jgi:hypothetical protein
MGVGRGFLRLVGKAQEGKEKENRKGLADDRITMAIHGLKLRYRRE